MAALPLYRVSALARNPRAPTTAFATPAMDSPARSPRSRSPRIRHVQSPRAMGIAGDELWYGGVRAPFHGMRSSNSLPTLGTQSSVSLRSGRSQSSSRRWDWDDSPAGYMPRPKRNTVEVPTLAVGAPERWITPAGLVQSDWVGLNGVQVLLHPVILDYICSL